jgi:hypothetical protein
MTMTQTEMTMGTNRRLLLILVMDIIVITTMITIIDTDFIINARA